MANLSFFFLSSSLISYCILPFVVVVVVVDSIRQHFECVSAPFFLLLLLASLRVTRGKTKWAATCSREHVSADQCKKEQFNEPYSFQMKWFGDGSVCASANIQLVPLINHESHIGEHAEVTTFYSVTNSLCFRFGFVDVRCTTTRMFQNNGIIPSQRRIEKNRTKNFEQTEKMKTNIPRPNWRITFIDCTPSRREWIHWFPNKSNQLLPKRSSTVDFVSADDVWRICHCVIFCRWLLFGVKSIGWRKVLFGWVNERSIESVCARDLRNNRNHRMMHGCYPLKENNMSNEI